MLSTVRHSPPIIARMDGGAELDLPEAFNDDGTLRQSIWWQATGAKYLDTAFLSAHAADPKAKLYVSNPLLSSKAVS